MAGSGEKVKRKVLWLTAGCVLLWIVGNQFGDFVRYVSSVIAINIMITLSLDVLLGGVGMISIGHAGFVAIGAYTSAVLSAMGVPFWVGIPLAGLLSMLCGLILAVPSLRLTGFYLAIATLAFGGVVIQIIRAFDVTGGAYGLQVALPSLFGGKLTSQGYFHFLMAMLAVFVFASLALSRSFIGKALLAVKNSEPATQSIGLNVVAVKLLAFAISGFGAGVAGALYGPLVGFIGTEHFTFMTSVSYVAMAVTGGPGTVGAFVGATLITAVPELLSRFRDYAELFWGATLLGVLLLFPRGLTHLFDKKTSTR